LLLAGMLKGIRELGFFPSLGGDSFTGYLNDID
jgi:hypothetical protein